MHRADEQAQRVDASQDHAREGDHGDGELGFKDAKQDQELAHEVGRAWHRQRGKRDEQKEGREHGSAERDASHLAHVLGAARTRGEQRDDEEQRRHHEAVVDHLQQCTLRTPRVQREDPQGDEAELRHRRVADDEARVGLREGHDRAVHDRDERE